MADIILVVVGLVIVLASFLISGKSEGEEQGKKEEKTPVMTREMLEACLVPLNAEINHRFDVKFEERWEETIADADDQMSQISNEKIMAVNDFSKEVLEKINQSHSDVVFMYKMMTDKEEELKQLLTQIRKEKKEFEELQSKSGTVKKEDTDERVKERSRNNNSDLLAEREENDKDELKERFEERLKNYKEEKEDPVKRQTEQLQKSRRRKEKEETMQKTGSSGNINDDILKLYQSGLTVKEISKRLNRGQGEVKLVVDLFTKNRAI